MQATHRPPALPPSKYGRLLVGDAARARAVSMRPSYVIADRMRSRRPGIRLLGATIWLQPGTSILSLGACFVGRCVGRPVFSGGFRALLAGSPLWPRPGISQTGFDAGGRAFLIETRIASRQRPRAGWRAVGDRGRMYYRLTAW